jgi:hypothetical protein
VKIIFLTIIGETVEKVPKQILGGDVEKNDFTECATINDLTIMKGRETPKNLALTILKGFSTVSVVIRHNDLDSYLEDFRKQVVRNRVIGFTYESSI